MRRVITKTVLIGSRTKIRVDSVFVVMYGGHGVALDTRLVEQNIGLFSAIGFELKTIKHVPTAYSAPYATTNTHPDRNPPFESPPATRRENP